MNNFWILFNTVKYLKLIQIYYHFVYEFRSRIRKKTGFHYLLAKSSKCYILKLEQFVSSYPASNGNCFSFLNLTNSFNKIIDWNYSKFGKLWTYNLTYFDFLQQEEISKEEGLRLIYDFIDQQDKIKDGFEPYPISLRGINWIKFISQHKIKDQVINDTLLAQFYFLRDNLEYHLLGNHLLENGFSLIFGAYYFQDERLYTKAKEILVKELKEQILKDGAHFELSPAYHQLIFFRVLDCINLVKNNSYKNQELLPVLEGKAEVMLSWINTMTYKNGDIPLFNDSAKNIAPTTKQLNEYATKLCINLQPTTINYQLSDSGYRKFENKKYEMIMDVGNIGPDYIPGHAHADTFSFELQIDQNPFIVDTGISTYEKNDLRQLERSTESHNTVTVNDKNQSQIWGGFRVGERAKIIDLQEEDGHIIASHDGYKKMGVIHQRSFICKKEEIEIKDTLIGKNAKGKAYFHLHPSIGNILIENKKVIFQDVDCQINFICSNMKIERKNYEYTLGFNKTKKSMVIQVSFIDELVSKILIKKN